MNNILNTVNNLRKMPCGEKDTTIDFNMCI